MKPKPYESNPCEKKSIVIKWIKPSTGATDQMDLPTADQLMIHLLETQQTHQLRRSKQWNQNRKPMWKKKKSNPSNDQTQQTELINPSTKQTQVKPIKTTRNRSTPPPPLKEPDLRRRQTGLSSSALHRHWIDIGLPCGFLCWVWNSPMA